MASTYTITSSSTWEGRIMTLTCTQTQNVANNTSTINWTLTTSGGALNSAGNPISYSTGPTTVTINGTQVYYKDRTAWSTGAFPASRGSVTGTLTVPHNSDGSKSISLSLSTAIYYGTVKTDSATWALDKVPRAAQISAASNFNDTSNPIITYSNPAGTAVTSLHAYIYAKDDSTVLVGARELSKTGTSYTFSDITAAERKALINACGNAKSTTVKFYIKTVISGSTLWSSPVDKTFSIVNGEPVITCSAVSITPKVIEVTGNDHTVIRGFGKVHVEMTAQAVKEGTIKTANVQHNNTTYNFTSGDISNPANGVFTFYAQDNRGFTKTETVNLDVINYVTLTNTFSLKMSAEGVLTVNTEGKYFKGSFSSATANELKLYYRYKTDLDEDYNDWILVAAEDVTISNDNSYEATVIREGLDYQRTYQVQVKAVDLLNELVSAAQGVNAFPVFDWGEKDFNFNVPVTIQGGQVPAVIDQDTNGEWVYKKWSDGLAECWCTKDVIVTFGSSANWGSLFTTGAITDSNLSFPSGLFIEIPNVQATLRTRSTGGLLMVPGGSGNVVTSATQTGAVEIARGTYVSGSQTYTINYYVRGKWK